MVAKEKKTTPMNLFSLFDIRKIHFKNRAVMAPMVLNCAGEDGSVTPVFGDFYAARARGGVGCIVLGGTFVHPDGRGGLTAAIFSFHGMHETWQGSWI